MEEMAFEREVIAGGRVYQITAKQLGRQPGAITARLEKLGLR